MVFWERVLTRWEKNRCSGNLESRGSEVLCGGERGRDRGGRCVSGCFGGSEGGLVSLPCFRGLFRAGFSYLGDVPAGGCEEFGTETYDCFMDFEFFALAGNR